MTAVRESALSFACGAASIALERYEPAGDETLPAVLFLHGRDGLIRGGTRYRALARQLAGHGFIVFVVDYFAGSPPGHDVMDLQRFFLWVQRISDAITFVSSQERVDGQRIGVMGISLGGYLALAVATRDSRVKAVVECCGGFLDMVLRAEQRLPPVLIVHGEMDQVVPVSEAQRLAHLLTKKVWPHEVHLYPNEGHVLSPAAAKGAMKRIVSFFGRHL